MKTQPYHAHLTLFSVDEAIEHCAIARRDFYLGLWAGRTLGLSGDALQDYARSVVEADYQEPGHDDVVRKLTRDFAAKGLGLTRAEIVRELQQMQTIAVRQLAASD